MPGSIQSSTINAIAWFSARVSPYVAVLYVFHLKTRLFQIDLEHLYDIRIVLHHQNGLTHTGLPLRLAFRAY